jgi:Icc protein
MDKTLRIAQITDCHLSGDPAQEYRGINPHANLNSLVQRVAAYAPDLVLATGDLSEDGSPASYEAFRHYLDPLGVSLLALPGNHDAAALLARMFPGSPVKSAAMTSHGEWQIIRLNSCLDGEPGGRLTGQALEHLENILQNEPDQPKLVALHHQPTLIGSPWIDKYPLFDPEDFLEVLDRAPSVKVVLWGHIHQVYESRMGGIAMLGSPSSAINGIRDRHIFTPDTLGPAFRWLELGVDGSFRTGITSI